MQIRRLRLWWKLDTPIVIPKNREKRNPKKAGTYTAKTSVLNSTPPVLWEVHTKLVLILTPVGVSLIPLGIKFNTGGCYSNTYQC